MKHSYESFSAISLVNQREETELRAWLNSQHARVFWLDGKKVFDESSFFTQAALNIPQPENRVAIDNWDAFLDNLRAISYEIETAKAFVVWSDAEAILHRGLETLLNAIDVFTLVAAEVAVKGSYPNVNQFRIILMGNGKNFPFRMR